MRDYIADNLDAIEPGLHIRGPQDIEVACKIGKRSVGRIDILAYDFQERLVVIECKLNVADASAIGQLIGYMAWARRHLALHDKVVRGMIVTTRLTALLDLALADFDHLPLRVVLVPARGSIPFLV